MSHGNLDQTVPQLPNVPTLELLQRHCCLKPMDIISMKESFLWRGVGGGGGVRLGFIGTKTLGALAGVQ